MANAAYNVVIKLGGAPVAFTDEPATLVAGETKKYKINDVTKRVLDRATAITAKDGTNLATVVSVDRLFGIIELAAPAVGQVTVTGKYVPVSVASSAHEYTWTLAGDLIDDTDYQKAQTNNGIRSRTYGLRDVSASISRFEDAITSWRDAWKSKTPVLVELRHAGATTDIWRGWFVIENDQLSGGVADLEGDAISLQLDGSPEAAFGIGAE